MAETPEKQPYSPPPGLDIETDGDGMIHVRPSVWHQERRARNERIAAGRARLPELLKKPKAGSQGERIEQLEEQVAALRDLLI